MPVELICANPECRKMFLTQKSTIKRGCGKYCSHPCFCKMRKRSDEERFWEKVEKTEECWTWKAQRSRQGYGRFSPTQRGKIQQMPAHRFSYEITYGPIQDNLLVCHKCDNPPCVRPEHLFLGTQKDNIQDAVIKGRMKGFGKNQPILMPKLKLTIEKVLEIRKLESIERPSIVAKMFGVSLPTICNIWKRRTWKNV